MVLRWIDKVGEWLDKLISKVAKRRIDTVFMVLVVTLPFIPFIVIGVVMLLSLR